MAKRKTYQGITITDFAAEGKCIYKSPETGVIFIDGKIAPGDVVDLEVYRSKKKFSGSKSYSPTSVVPAKN